MELVNIKTFKIDKQISSENFDVEGTIEKYNKTEVLDAVVVDSEYSIISNYENYFAALKIGLPVVPARRKTQSDNNISGDFPKRFLVEITSKCNLKCKMCPRNALKRPEMHMDFSLFKKAIDEMSKYKINGLWLYNLGESLLHPNFFEMLDYVSQYENLHPLWLSTNGILLTKQNSLKLLNSKLDYLNFSLNAMTEQGYQEISPRSNFKLVNKNLNNLVELKKKSKRRKPFLRVQMIDQPEVRDQIKDFIKEWGPKADVISINTLEGFAGEVDPNIGYIPERERGKKMCRRILRGDFYIFSNGNVTFCATDFNGVNKIGNIRNKTIKEMWDGPKYRNFIKLNMEGKYHRLPVCNKCLDWDLA